VKIAIVTPEFPELLHSGGIGTFSKELVEILSGIHDVSVIIPFNIEFKKRIEFSKKYNISIVDWNELGKFAKFSLLNYAPHNQIASLYISHYIEDNHFDLAIFADYGGLAFYTNLSKRMGVIDSNTQTVVVAHGNSKWVAEGMKHQYEWNNPTDFSRIHFMELQSMRSADHLISPSKYMADYLLNSGIIRDIQVIPNPVSEFLRPKSEIPKLFSTKVVLGYLGRLEERKGIRDFLQVVQNLSDIGLDLEVHLYGKCNVLDGKPADEYVRTALSESVDVVINSDLNTSQAILKLKEKNTILLFCAENDNYPYTVLETVIAELRVLGRNSGGHSEILPPSALFNSVEEAVDRIVSLVSGKLELENYKAPLLQRNLLWKQFVSDLDFSTHVNADVEELKEAPLISILVTHFNLGRYLDSALNSLLAQTYKNIEILIVDDGSTDPESISKLKSFENSSIPNLKIYWEENRYLGGARNFLAQNANGTYIIFFDADNVAFPNMVESMVQAVLSGKLRILTIPVLPFEDGTSHNYRPGLAAGCYMPLGGPLLEGLSSNVFGDANFIIERDFFNSIGGFTEDKGIPFEDWEFLAKCAFKDGALAVYPKPLLHYRARIDSMLRTTSKYSGELRVLRSFEQMLPETERWQIQTYLYPLLKNSNFDYSDSRNQFFKKIIYRLEKYIPIGSRRRNLAKKIYLKVITK
jgi:glycosyltransferase involved in cell wall biosynthesis